MHEPAGLGCCIGGPAPGPRPRLSPSRAAVQTRAALRLSRPTCSPTRPPLPSPALPCPPTLSPLSPPSCADGGRQALKNTWYVICGFSSIQCLVAIICAAFNSQTPNGYKSASFAAIWNMFIIMGFCRVSYSVVFHSKSSEILVGAMMGISIMLAQLFFVLMVVFFIFGSEADVNNPTVAPSDNAYGAFSFFNMLAYFAWSILLTMHRHSVINSETNDKNVIEDGDQYLDGDASGMDGEWEVDYSPGGEH